MSKRVLFTSTFKTTFIEKDIEIFKSFYQLDVVIAKGFIGLAKKINHLFKNDICFIWFASTYSSILVFLSKLLNKKTIIVIGGVDVAMEKELNYGIWNSWWRKYFVRFAIVNANLILAVDESLKQKAISLCKYNGKNINIVPTGYDENFWRRITEKENFVLMVANVRDEIRLKIKGINIFLDVAKLMPKIKFKLIGLDKNLKINIPENVEVINFVNQSQLQIEYSRAKVYCQLSLIEGLPNTLCEAMLCECIPIGTDVGGIKNAIGETGIVLPTNEIETIRNAILFSFENFEGAKARQRIINNFDIKKRIEFLTNIINNF
ncbi:MAG: glycosyltransferase family 4 protein [Bacteroidota bacterium]